MKIKMYTSAFAMMAVLGGCLGTDTEVVSTPAPVADLVPTGPTLDKLGLVATYTDGADAEAVRANAFSATDNSPESTEAKKLRTDYVNSQESETAATLLRNELSTLGDLPTNGDNDARANAIIFDINKIIIEEIAKGAGATEIEEAETTGENGDIRTYVDLDSLIKAVQTQIDFLTVRIVTDNKALVAKLITDATTTEDDGETFNDTVTLADGTVLDTRTIGFVDATQDGVFVAASLVAAYEEDDQGRITRVAFLETSGADYVPSDAVNEFSGRGRSIFAVKVDDGFFEAYEGESDITLNSDAQNGIVTAIAGNDNSVIEYTAGVTFNPTTGAFTGTNGVFDRTLNGRDEAEDTTLTANNAETLGQVHGDFADGHYTGLISANTDRLEVVGGIIGVSQQAK